MCRHHQHPGAAWLPLPGGGDGLGEPVRPAWQLSNTLDARFCTDALDEALAGHGALEIFNTDQGSQFTSFAFTGRLQASGSRISMDGWGRCMDNTFIERLWRSLTYEAIYLRALPISPQAQQQQREGRLKRIPAA